MQSLEQIDSATRKLIIISSFSINWLFAKVDIPDGLSVNEIVLTVEQTIMRSAAILGTLGTAYLLFYERKRIKKRDLDIEDEKAKELFRKESLQAKLSEANAKIEEIIRSKQDLQDMYENYRHSCEERIKYNQDTINKLTLSHKRLIKIERAIEKIKDQLPSSFAKLINDHDSTFDS